MFEGHGIRVYLNGCYGAGNLGDDLLMNVSARHLHAALGDDALLRVRSRGASLPWLPGLPRQPRAETGGRLAQLLAIARSDLYLWGGGTFLYDDARLGQDWKGLLSMLVTVLWARFCGVPVVLYGIGIGRFATPAGRLLARGIVALASLITVRERHSYMRLRAWRRRQVHLANDLVYDLPRRAPVARPRTFVFNAHMASDPARLARLAGEAAEFVRSCGVEPVDAEVILLAAWADDGGDGAANAAAMTYLRSVGFRRFADAGVGLESRVDAIAGAAGVVGERLHVLLLAAMHARPFRCLPYHPKVLYFLDDIGWRCDFASSAAVECARRGAAGNLFHLARLARGMRRR